MEWISQQFVHFLCPFHHGSTSGNCSGLHHFEENAHQIHQRDALWRLRLKIITFPRHGSALFLRNPVRIAFHLLLREFFDDKRRSQNQFSLGFATTHNAQQISIFMPYFPCHVSFFFSRWSWRERGMRFYGSFWYGEQRHKATWKNCLYLWMPTTTTAICNTCDDPF